MSRRFLLPLHRLDVEFQVRHGRRWSAVEHLLLWACGEPSSAQELASRADIPVRLVAESLVNLLRAGWIELHSSGGGNLFASTGAGRQAAARPLPEHFMESQGRRGTVFLDRLIGEPFSPGELDIVRWDAPGFRPEDVLEPNLFKPVLHAPGLLDRLPMGEDDTFDRVKALKLSPVESFAEIFVDADRIEGLPNRTPAALGIAVRTSLGAAVAAGTLPAGSLPSVEAALGPPLQARATAAFTLGPDTLLVGGEEHLAAADALIRRAVGFLIVHSTFIGKNIVHLLPALREAAASGVQLHIHWGKADDPEGLQPNPSEMAARLVLADIPQESRKNVHLAERSTGSHAKIIFAQTSLDGDHCALVGSCNWLDSPFRSVEASVRLDEPVVLGQLAWHLASILVPVFGEDRVVDRLIAIYENCQAQPIAAGLHSASVVTDENHYAAVRDAMKEAGPGGTVILGSHKFGHAAATTVFDPMVAAARRGAIVKLFFTKVLPNFGAERAGASQESLARDAVDLSRAGADLHAKFIGWNDRLLVTSFNFLSASMNGRNRGGSEFGILINGPGIVNEFQEKLKVLGVLSEWGGGEQPPAKRRRPRRKKSTSRGGEN